MIQKAYQYKTASCWSTQRSAASTQRAVVVLLLSFLQRQGRLGVLGEQHGVDVRQHASLGDSHVLEQLVQLLVVSEVRVLYDDRWKIMML